METTASGNAAGSAILSVPTGSDGKGGGKPFIDLVEEEQGWIDKECTDITRWVAEQTGSEPERVVLSRAWFGEDRRAGVLVFHASISRPTDGTPPPVTDWWVVRERSGERWIYPCLLTSAGDAVRYHRQVRTVQVAR